MKNNLLKYYIVAIYFCSTLIAFADPGDDNDTGDLEGNDPLSIDNYVWVAVALVLIFAFFKFRSQSQQKNLQK